MDDAELVGGALSDAPDPRQAARELTDLLLAADSDRDAALRAGLHPDLVDVLRTRIGGDLDQVAAVCQEGAAWVLGRRSVAAEEPWDLVASLPSGAVLPPGLHRTTGETLVKLVVEATMTVRFAAPFIDRTGLAFLSDALAAATARDVTLEILMPTRSSSADDALEGLTLSIRRNGSVDRFSVSRLRRDAPWAHLKVMTSDAAAAYIGSANITAAGLAGRNLELGVLVRGRNVAAIDQLLDAYREV